MTMNQDSLKCGERDGEAKRRALSRLLGDGDELEEFRERALEEKCGVFGVISNGDWPTSLDVAQIICLGLVGLQHRGQESAGIVTCKYKSEPFNVSRAEGLVSQAFSEMSMMSLKGNLGIGHTRYSTSGGSGCLQLAQPFVVHTKYGTIAVAHNGELVNSGKLRETLLSHGVGLTTGGDSELITQCLSQTPPDEFRHPRHRQREGQSASSRAMIKRTSISGSNGQAPEQAVAVAAAAAATTTTTTASGGGGGGGEGGGGTNSADGQSAQNGKRAAPVWRDDLTVDEDIITSRLLYLMSLTPVSYSLIVMYNECLYATRDPFGNRPLSLGMLVPQPNAGALVSIPYSLIDDCYIEGWCISSESCPFPSVHAKLKRDVEPGEIVKFERNKMPKTLALMPRPQEAKSPSFCIFEYVYFARPDSILEKQAVYTVRMRCGERLADESPAVAPDNPRKADFIVAPVPESSIPAALGYAQRIGIPYVEVFCKNRYVGRTFIQPSTRLRRLGVAKKFGPLSENFSGKSIILIDDSIVRGTTIGQLVRLLREAGAKEVHIRIASPPLHFPCYMGINIPTKEELIANHLSPEQLALTLGAASLKYLSVEGLRESVQFGIKRQLRAQRQVSRAAPDCGSPKLAQRLQQQQLDSSAIVVDSELQKQQQQQQQALCNGSEPNGAAAAACDEAAEVRAKVGHCVACLTGEYPVKLDEDTF